MKKQHIFYIDALVSSYSYFMKTVYTTLRHSYTAPELLQIDHVESGNVIWPALEMILPESLRPELEAQGLLVRRTKGCVCIGLALQNY